MTERIAALYIDPKGPYPTISNVDCWDARKDARKYAGPFPVVAHPPCQLWGAFAAINFKRWGGEHNRPGNDQGCFAHALWSVASFGGVLEHPARSRAWDAFAIPRPTILGWQSIRDLFWVGEVWQSAYGHLAQKRTWLLYRGTREPAPFDLHREPGTHQCGWFDRIKPTLGKRAASATPIAFAEYLVALARSACR